MALRFRRQDAVHCLPCLAKSKLRPMPGPGSALGELFHVINPQKLSMAAEGTTKRAPAEADALCALLLTLGRCHLLRRAMSALGH